MRILFVHLAFPTQYRHLAPHLAALGHEVVGLRQANMPETPLPGVRQLTYDPPVEPQGLNDDERIAVTYSRRGARVAVRVGELRRSGFSPDVICSHIAWGCSLFLKDVVPDAKVLLYCEFMGHARNSTHDFDPEFSVKSPAFWTRITNGPDLSSLATSDRGISPTYWQRKQFPKAFESHISVIHDGIDTDLVKPQPAATFQWNGRTFSRDAEVVTFISNSLEPYRGFHTFMRAIPEIQQRRPKAQIVIVGQEEPTYSTPLLTGESYRALMLRELDGRIDLSRVHFCGRLPREQYLSLLQISSAHVYLTYPFTLSWSATEAMAAGCLIIGSRTPPVEEVIKDGVNGLLVDFFSPTELAAGVAEALENTEAMQPFRNAARQTIVDRYDLKRICLPAQLSFVTT